jgi:hypothetical protein
VKIYIVVETSVPTHQAATRYDPDDHIRIPFILRGFKLVQCILSVIYLMTL